MPTIPAFRNAVGSIPTRGPRVFPTMPVRGAVKYVDGVFEGGGALGSAYVGSLTLLADAGYWFRRVAGNSAGAINAAMVAAGYNAADIEWLCSGYPNPPRRPPGVPTAMQPIHFMDFLDFPTLASIGIPARRKTLIWKWLEGGALDQILATPVTLIPTQASTVNAIVGGMKAIPVFGLGITGIVETQLRNVLNGILAFMPNTTPHLRDLQLFDTQPMRIKFADAVWEAIASVDPLLVLSTQFLHEGSVFEGTKFLDTMRNLLQAKVTVPPANNGRVLFRDLPIPLAVIGTNIQTGRMEVYSSGATPGMEVAEAVRRSMSIPLVFQPRGNIVVDGGLCSNFPAWLFTPAGAQHWPAASIDPARPKVGFSLDDSKPAPASWGAGAPKFALTGTPPHVAFQDVMIGVVIAGLQDAGLYVPNVNLPQARVESDLIDCKAIEVALGSFQKIDKEAVVRKTMMTALFAGMPYFDVEIPLLGFHWLDFSINDDKGSLFSIAERGWFAARDALAAVPTLGVPLILNPGSLASPYP